MSLLKPIHNPVIQEEREHSTHRPRFGRRVYNADEFQRLSALSTTRTFFAIGVQYLIMASAVTLAVLSNHWALILVSMIVIATRQHALSVLVHEGVHYRLLKNKRLNDILCDFFCAFPLLMSTQLYRRTHFDHHRYLNSEKDPDWNFMTNHPDWMFPQSKWKLVKILLKDLLFLNIGFNLISGPVPKLWSPLPRLLKKKDLPLGQRLFFVGYLATLISLLSLTHSLYWFAILWLIPSFTFLNIIFRIRTLVEHLGLNHQGELSDTRSMPHINWLERFLFAPLGINYHLEHHMFPSIPWYNLPHLHRFLMQNEAYRDNASLAPSYLGKGGAIQMISK